MPPETPKRVLAIAPMPPEKCAYALARYSRSPDSIRESMEWVRTHDSRKFLESFYFQYGHASIADLGHVVLCFEGISELAATEVEDEQLWDGQARSSRYQNFSRSGVVAPPEFDADQVALYLASAARLLEGYTSIHARAVAWLKDRLPRPDLMKPDAYERNIGARAFDIARYLLPFGVPTGIGQVTSIRTLERQIRRLKASEYAELRSLGSEIGEACAGQPDCRWYADSAIDPIAPTLARNVDTDEHARQAHADLKRWAADNLPPARAQRVDDVDLLKPTHVPSDVAATLLYPVTDRPYRELYEFVCSAGEALRKEVVDVAAQSRTRRDELLREFRGDHYVFDITMDIGAYRDLHRHRRCQQFRQSYSGGLGYSIPNAIDETGARDEYVQLMDGAMKAAQSLPEPGAHYLLPFGTRARFLFKMDFAEAEYIARLRSGVKGHVSYREVAWKMKERMAALEPELGRLMEATAPWVQDPLTR